MIGKIKTIIFSRFKKPKQESWIADRRRICAICTWNTKNQTKLSLRVRFIKFLSDSYSYVTGTLDEDNLGNCTACEICSIYFKTAEEVSHCEIDSWKSIYIPNKK